MTIKVSPELYEWVKNEAEKLGLTISAYGNDVFIVHQKRKLSGDESVGDSAGLVDALNQANLENEKLIKMVNQLNRKLKEKEEEIARANKKMKHVSQSTRVEMGIDQMYADGFREASENQMKPYNIRPWLDMEFRSIISYQNYRLVSLGLFSDRWRIEKINVEPDLTQEEDKEEKLSTKEKVKS